MKLVTPFLVATVTAAAAASPQQNSFYAFAPPEPYATATPAPRATSPDAFAPAPMPDGEISAPVASTPDDPHAAQLSPELFRPQKQFRGDAFTYGSTNQSVENRTVAPAPGVSMKMPLY